MILHLHHAKPPACAAAVLLAAALAGCHCRGGAGGQGQAGSGDEPGPRLVVLAVSGLDHGVVEDLVGKHKLPHIARLHRVPLATATPADPAVAWASFATGTVPAVHGIVGEVARMPESYELSDLHFTGSLTDPGSPPRSLLAEEPFWITVSKHDRHVRVLRAPSSFPPGRVEDGEVLSGPGTPGIAGDAGSYILVRSGPTPGGGRSPAGGVLVPATALPDGGWKAAVPGPRRDGQILHAEVVFTTGNAVGKGAPTLRANGGEGEVEASEGQWSDWMALSFGGGSGQVRGIARFLPLSLESGIEVLMEPPGADPWAPLVPLSSPRYYAGFLADRYGRYRTTGSLVDVRAFAAGVIDLPSLLRQTYASWEEQERMTLGEFGRGGWDLFVSVFPQPGPAVHIIARAGGEKMPASDAGMIESYGDTVEKLYSRLDGMVGEIMKGLHAEDRLILVGVRSARPVRREFNLTAWLVKERYCVLQRKARTSSLDGFADYDWQATRAWAAGSGGIFLNNEGREPVGVVQQGQESEDLLEEIRSKLLGLRDEGRPVVKEVLRGDELFQGPARGRAPDLLILLQSGYGIGPAGMFGGVPARVFQDSKRPWVPMADGGHPSDARGVMLTTFTPRSEPAVTDIAPTVLGFFGIKPLPSCTGKNLW